MRDGTSRRQRPLGSFDFFAGIATTNRQDRDIRQRGSRARVTQFVATSRPFSVRRWNWMGKPTSRGRVRGSVPLLKSDPNIVLLLPIDPRIYFMNSRMKCEKRKTNA